MRGTGAACAPERRPYRQHVRVMVVALLASMAAACQHDAGPMASARGPTGATVAFESIDGPPIGVFNKLVQNLNEEADVRQVPVVSREGAAHYRVRGYLAAHVERKRTVIAWVWDVYDSEQRRVLRVTGEEPSAGAHTVRTAWSAADERVLRRIAQSSLDNLVRFLGAPARSGSTAIAFSDDSPPPAGVFASSRSDRGPGSGPGASPPPRPAQASAPARTMAFTIE